MVYAVGKDGLYVNLYAQGEALVEPSKGAKVRITQTTDYPWSGRIRLMISPEVPLESSLNLRIPGWACGRPVPGDLYRFASSDIPGIALRVNGKPVDATSAADGYVHLLRRWEAGDVVELDLPMPVQRVYAHGNVEADRGKVALMRGPPIYCLEAVDHPQTDVLRVSLAPEETLAAEHRPDLLGGVTVLRAGGRDAAGNFVALTAVPYYSWQNREPGPMVVWINEP